MDEVTYVAIRRVCGHMCVKHSSRAVYTIIVGQGPFFLCRKCDKVCNGRQTNLIIQPTKEISIDFPITVSLPLSLRTSFRPLPSFRLVWH